MKKAKVITKGKRQYICLPEEYRIDEEGILLQEHELGILIIDPKKRWRALEKVMGTVGDDFFPDGYKDDSVWTKREDWTKS